MTINKSEILTRKRLILQYPFEKSYKSISGISRKRFPGNLALVKSRIRPVPLLEKVFVVDVLLGINLFFYRNYFHQHLPETYLVLLQTSKIGRANPTKWLNIFKQFVSKLLTNCLSVFDHFVGLALKGLIAGVLVTPLIFERLFMKTKSNLRCCINLPGRKSPIQIVKYVRKMFCRISHDQLSHVQSEHESYNTKV